MIGKNNIHQQTKPVVIGKKPLIHRVLGSVKKGFGRAVEAVGKVGEVVGKGAQIVLDGLNSFPFLKPILKTPIPIPVLGVVKLETLLKGVAIGGRLTGGLARAYRRLSEGASLQDVFKELPIGDIVSFILSPILEAFKGVLNIMRIGGSQPQERITRFVSTFKGMIQKVPVSLRKQVVKQVENKIGFKFPPAVINIIEAV